MGRYGALQEFLQLITRGICDRHRLMFRPLGNRVPPSLVFPERVDIRIIEECLMR